MANHYNAGNIEIALKFDAVNALDLCAGGSWGLCEGGDRARGPSKLFADLLRVTEERRLAWGLCEGGPGACVWEGCRMKKGQTVRTSARAINSAKREHFSGPGVGLGA